MISTPRVAVKCSRIVAIFFCGRRWSPMIDSSATSTFKTDGTVGSSVAVPVDISPRAPMPDVLGIAPFFCGSLLTFCIMYTVKNPRLRDSQGKFLGLMIVILTVGVLIIVSGYGGLLSSPFTDTGSSTNQLTNAPPYHPAHVNSGITTSEILNAISTKFIYGIMFDAGSTGSRIHVFKFKQTDPNKPFEFVEELFEKVQPGLSAYADEPKEASASLKGMLDKAKAFIPKDQWESTPIGLKATAGLRKLKPEQADNILNEVRQLFIDHPFQHGSDSVVIMEGTDEGVFSWFTVNFYAKVLGDGAKMEGVMDLGGGSTQITFTPNEQETLQSSPKEYILNKNILGKDTKLYTHSYLDLGLMAGRLQTMGGKVGLQASDSQPLPILNSACFLETYSGSIEFGQDEYTIKGEAPKAGSRFESCYGAAKQVVSNYHIHTSPEIQNKPFCLISYYFDKAVEAGLVDAEKGGLVKVSDFKTSAKDACEKASTDKPYLCLDLCFLASLLHEGFKLHPEVTVPVRKTINGQEISWALGAMFDFFSNQKHR